MTVTPTPRDAGFVDARGAVSFGLGFPRTVVTGRNVHDRARVGGRCAAEARHGREQDALPHRISLINARRGAAPGASEEAGEDTPREGRGVLGVLRQVDRDTAGPGPGGGFRVWAPPPLDGGPHEHMEEMA
ncbi:hypothetical protein [Actinomadura roseirufa]|uniref:hypothetical protein n=1 Tax=Actinomadura roseirufa TaxID=2094049 RepID=UPI001041079A|nr:hypothetical protein [Actinomadura roseirufa]